MTACGSGHCIEHSTKICVFPNFPFLSINTMARQLRLTCAGQAHHLLQSGIDRQPIFRDDDDRVQFLRWLQEAARQFQVSIHAYVLMPDHLHLLATPVDQTGLGRMVQWVGRHYVPYFNRKYGRSGTLFQGRFKTAVLEAEPNLLNCMHYIESNPVRAGLMGAADEFRWSSYAHHAGIKSDAIVTDHLMYWSLGNTPFHREASYRARVNQALSPAVTKELTAGVLKSRVMGTSEFQAKLAKLIGRPVSPGKRGRPSKKVMEIPATTGADLFIKTRK